MKSQHISKWIVIGFLPGLLVMGGCQKFQAWREKKLAEVNAQQTPTTGPATFKDPSMTDPEPEPKGKAASQPARKKLNLNPPESRPAGSIGSAVLMVNQDYITAEEMLRRIRTQLEATALTYDENVYKRRAEELLSNTIRDMISEQLLYQEIAARITEEQNPVVEKAVDKEVNNIKTMDAGGSKILLEKMLAEHGSSIEELRKQMRKQIVTQQYLREKLKPGVIVTRDELWDYYQSHQDDFAEPASVHLRLIEIDPEKYLPEGMSWDHANDDEQKKAQDKAQSQLKAVKGKLAKGVDFSKVAMEYSTAISGRVGGEMGWISRGSYRLKALEDAAFRLKVGSVGPPILIENKTFLVKVVEFKPGRSVSFTEAQDQIRAQLEQDIYRRLVMVHLKKLWEKSQIGSVDTFLEGVYDRLPEYDDLKKKKPGKP
jgi:peptidyl-prolyl cis-trans isomerase SurA